MKKFYAMAAAVALVIFAGCASIVDGPNQMITIQSLPVGAKVTVDGVDVGVTPLTTNIKRKEGTRITVKLDGYKDVSIDMVTKMNSTFWGNILIGGLPGSTTDAATGAIKEYAPNSYSFTLEKK